MESNPKNEHVLLSAGHDGQVFLWDIDKGESVAHFVNNIDGQGHGGVFDAKWSPDGTMIAATDSHGHILIFGLGINPDRYKIVSKKKLNTIQDLVVFIIIFLFSFPTSYSFIRITGHC